MLLRLFYGPFINNVLFKQFLHMKNSHMKQVSYEDHQSSVLWKVYFDRTVLTVLNIKNFFSFYLN